MYNKDTKKIKKIRYDKLRSDNPSVSSMSVHGASITTISPDKDRIPKKGEKKKLSEILIIGNEITQEPDNQSKKAKADSSIYEKNLIEKTPPPYKTRQGYEGGNNDKTRESDYSPSDTDACAKNIDDGHKNEEDDGYIQPPSEKN